MASALFLNNLAVGFTAGYGIKDKSKALAYKKSDIIS